MLSYDEILDILDEKIESEHMILNAAIHYLEAFRHHAILETLLNIKKEIMERQIEEITR